jgi:hypothetical protein
VTISVRVGARVTAPVVISLAFAVAAATGPATADAASPPAVIRLVSTTTSYSSTDKPPKGASAGDRQVFTSRLRNAAAQFGKPKGAVVGSDRSTLVVTATRRARMQTVAKLPGGTITVSGLLRAVANGAISVPVVSGTGLFEGAKGTLTILKPIDANTAGNIYRLTYGPVA